MITCSNLPTGIDFFIMFPSQWLRSLYSPEIIIFSPSVKKSISFLAVIEGKQIIMIKLVLYNEYLKVNISKSYNLYIKTKMLLPILIYIIAWLVISRSL